MSAKSPQPPLGFISRDGLVVAGMLTYQIFLIDADCDYCSMLQTGIMSIMSIMTVASTAGLIGKRSKPCN